MATLGDILTDYGLFYVQHFKVGLQSVTGEADEDVGVPSTDGLLGLLSTSVRL